MELENACGAMKSPKSAIWTTLKTTNDGAAVGGVRSVRTVDIFTIETQYMHQVLKGSKQTDTKRQKMSGSGR